VDRLILALIAMPTRRPGSGRKGQNGDSGVMRFHPRIAPIKVAVFPLLKNRPELVLRARQICDVLRPHMAVFMMTRVPSAGATVVRMKPARRSESQSILIPSVKKDPS